MIVSSRSIAGEILVFQVTILVSLMKKLSWQRYLLSRQRPLESSTKRINYCDRENRMLVTTRPSKQAS
jgi:hypothetical protein